MEFKEIKRKKERGLSNDEFLNMLKSELIDSKAIVCVALKSDDTTISSYSTQDNSLQALGLVVTAQDQLLAEMRE